MPSISELEVVDVALPAGVIITQHIRKRGEYRRLNSVMRVTAEGEHTVDGKSYPLTWHKQRDPLSDTPPEPDSNAFPSIASDLSGLALPAEVIERLSWLMQITLHKGLVWKSLLDSHTGEMLANETILPSGDVLQMTLDDYRVVEGIRYPFLITYLLNGRGTRLLMEGSADSPWPGIRLLVMLLYFYLHLAAPRCTLLHLGISFVLSALLATPGCEMRSIPQLMRKLTGNPSPEHHCPAGFLTALDRWELSRRSGNREPRS